MLKNGGTSVVIVNVGTYIEVNMIEHLTLSHFLRIVSMPAATH